MKQLQQVLTGVILLIFGSLRSAENNNLQVCDQLPRDLNKVILSLQDNFFYDTQKDLALIVKNVPNSVRNQTLFVAKKNWIWGIPINALDMIIAQGGFLNIETIYHKDIPVRALIAADYEKNYLEGLGPNKQGLCVMLKFHESSRNKHIVYKMPRKPNCCLNLLSKITRTLRAIPEQNDIFNNHSKLICLHPHHNKWVIKTYVTGRLEFFSHLKRTKLDQTVRYNNQLLFLKYNTSLEYPNSFIGVFKTNHQTQIGRYEVENDALTGKDIFNITLEGYYTDNVHLEQSKEFSDFCLLRYQTYQQQNKTLLISLAQKKILKVYSAHISFLQPFDYCSKHKILGASLANKVLIPVKDASLNLVNK